MMKPDEILQYCLDNLEGTILVSSCGEKGIFYNPGHLLKRGVYVLTVEEKDGDNDKGSRLNDEKRTAKSSPEKSSPENRKALTGIYHCQLGKAEKEVIS